MASTQQMQARAKAKKKADALLAKLSNPNTTSWVDEGYSKLLAAQLVNKLSVASHDLDRSCYLNRMRKDFAYVCEEPIRGGTRVWFLDNSISRKGQVILSPFDYDEKGRRIEKSIFNGVNDTIYISKHGLERVYQRLRSNSLTDAKDCIKALLVLMGTPPEEGEEAEVKVEGGTFYLCSDNLDVAAASGVPPDASDDHPVILHANEMGNPIGTTTVGELRKRRTKPFWLVKTYIDKD